MARRKRWDEDYCDADTVDEWRDWMRIDNPSNDSDENNQNRTASPYSGPHHATSAADQPEGVLPLTDRTEPISVTDLLNQKQTNHACTESQ